MGKKAMAPKCKVCGATRETDFTILKTECDYHYRIRRNKEVIQINRAKGVKPLKRREFKRTTGKTKFSNLPKDKKTRTKFYQIHKKYNLTYEEYNKMLVRQNFSCDICKIHQSKLDTPLVVDHSHKTDKVRSLICNTCNIGLGMFKDNPDLLKQAYGYLNKHK